ncbi:MAG: ATP-binding cassette domain-containing protein, partial [Chloroflexi bacterium]|nr:ATP-binding cassette domain-containing protein [Chloroflexota bacterium]
MLVEQSVNVALTVCRRAVFMEKGEVRFEGATADLLERPELLRSVFLQGAAAVNGADATGQRAERGEAARVRTKFDVERLTEAGITLPVVLEGVSLHRNFGGVLAVDDVSVKLHQGEILGLIGANGAGKTTLLDLLAGYITADAGRVILAGTDVTEWSPDARARAGLGRSFQDARLFPSLTVAEVIAVALERHIDIRDPLSTVLAVPAARRAEEDTRERVEELIELMNLGAFRDKFVAELSTGSRRIVDLACALAHGPKVLLLDEPSSGIAQREAEALGPVLERVQQQ